MRAIMIDQPGGPESMRLERCVVPKPLDDEVLVKVAFSGVNWADIQFRAGLYPHPLGYPTILGKEISGEIVAVGASAEDKLIGGRVCALVPSGGYAEYVAVKQSDVTIVPDIVPLDVAAASQMQALTAYHLLHSIHNVTRGEYVLCHAVGGGVGLYVTQIAHRAGARVIGTVRRKGKEDLPLEYGAQRVINTEEEDFVNVVREITNGQGVNLAIDSLGASMLDRTYDAMKLLGHIINIGEAEEIPYSNIRNRILPKSLTFSRFHLPHVRSNSDLWDTGQSFILDAVVDGWLDVPISESLPLDHVVDAHRILEGGMAAGKLLLDMSK